MPNIIAANYNVFIGKVGSTLPFNFNKPKEKDYHANSHFLCVTGTSFIMPAYLYHSV